MGSGYGSSYSSGGPQPFAPTYHVVASMMAKDKQDCNIYSPNKGYFKNPFASYLQDSIVNNQVRMNGRVAHGTYTYILDTNGNIVFAKRFNPNNSKSRAPHPTLVGGKNPEVQCAGMINFNKGRIVWYNNDSGHFRPHEKSLLEVDKAIEKIRKTNPEVFSKKYEGGKKRE